MNDHARQNDETSASRLPTVDSVQFSRINTVDTALGEIEQIDHGLSEVQSLQYQRKIPLARRTTVLQGPIAEPVNSASLICGLSAGVAQAGVFNPYDRALYLSVKDNRPFLHPTNWYRPYTGFAQSLGGRAVQGGLYFPLEHFFLRFINNAYQKTEESDAKLNFLAGTAAGALNAVLLNPISAVKYKTWGREVNHGVLHEVLGMLKKSGSLRPFYNGLLPTVMRDVVFGGTYTWLRLQIKVWFDLSKTEQWMGNFVAAGFATVLSGPFNYVRTIQFATRSQEKAASTMSILSDLAKQTMDVHNGSSTLASLRFLQNKLRVGWGTARVAMGMTFAHAVYNWLHENLKPQLESR